MHPGTEFSMAQRKIMFLSTLEAWRGHIGKSCIAAGIHRSTYDRWRKDDEDFAARCIEIREMIVDDVEDKLMDNINDGNTQAIIFYLKTQGKGRGYVERQEISGPDGKPLELINTITINLAVLSTTELEQLSTIAHKIRDAAVDDDDEEAHGESEHDGRSAAKLISFNAPKPAVRAGQS
jgi:hypothetical protein